MVSKEKYRKNPEHHKKIQNTYRQNNKEKFAEYGRIYRKKYKDAMKAMKYGKFCVECGWNKYPEILEFHHPNPKNKEIGIGASHYSIKRVLKEMNKCVLLCPNCHRYLHYKRGQKLDKL